MVKTLQPARKLHVALLMPVLRVLVAVVALSGLFACANSGVDSSANLTFPPNANRSSRDSDVVGRSQGPLERTSWLAEDIRGRGVIDDAQSTVSFDGDGRVSGSGGCNRFIGSVEIRGESIAFGNLASTRMACAPALMDQEHKFLDALAAARSYRFANPGHKLVLVGADGALLVRFSEHAE